MAKQYIPGVSGLLTEPNPADSPSNTLSEAENVVIEQGGKVQSRHGFNITEEDTLAFNSLNYPNPVPSISRLKGKAYITGKTQLIGSFTVSATSYIYYYDTFQLRSYTINSGTYTLDSLITALTSLYGQGIFDNFDSRLRISSSSYIQIAPNTTNIFGFVIGEYAYSTDVKFNYLNNTMYNSYYNNGETFYKFFQYKNELDSPITGYIVKQNKNEYGMTFYKPLGEDTQVYNVSPNYSDTPKYAIYQIDSNSSRLINFDEIPYDTVNNLFNTDKSLYLSTEDGIAECNIQDTFIPTYNRFFTVKWPSFPEVIYSFSQSTTTENWLKSGYKCGIRITFYRETGYSDNDGLYEYESPPSKIYEIFNNGKDSILNLELNFKAVIENTELYKQFNEFTKFNNGRKFGIKIYRTKSVPVSVIVDGVPVAKALPEEYRLCALPIAFDSLFTTSLVRITDITGTEKIGFEEYGVVSQYRKENTLGEAKLNDIYSYIPNTSNTTGNVVKSGFVFSSEKIQYQTTTTRDNDIISGKLKITGKTINSVIQAFSSTDSFNGSGSDTTMTSEIPYKFLNDTTNYFAFPYKNQESLIKYINNAELVVMTAFVPPVDPRTVFNSASEIEIAFWEYEKISKTDPITNTTSQFLNLKNKLSSGSLKLTDNIYKNWPLSYVLDQGIETSYLSTNPVFPNTINTIGYTGSTTFNNNQVTYMNQNYMYFYEGMPIKFGGNALGLPAELNQTTTYFVKSLSANGRNFSLSSTSGGSSITFSNKTYNSSEIVTVYPVGLWKVNISLNQMLQINPLSSYMVVVKCASLPSAYRLSLPLMANHNYTADNGITYPLYPVETFNWAEGSNPSNYKLIVNSPSESIYPERVLQNYGLKLSRKENKYNYTFTALNDIKESLSNGTRKLLTNQTLNVVSTPTISTTPAATYFKARITQTSPVARFTTYTTTDLVVPPSTYTYIDHGFSNGTKIKFDGVLPTPLSGATTYYVKLVTGSTTTFEISTTLDGTSVIVNPSLPADFWLSSIYVVEPYPLIDNRYLIKNFNISLDSNDDYINALPELYTNPFQDGESYTNTIAPNSKLIGQYKDVTLYAGIKEPLNASFSVTKLPAVEQIKLYHYGTSPIPSIGSITTTSFPLAETYTGSLLSSDFNTKRELYIDSNIFNKKIVQITSYTASPSTIGTNGNIVSRYNDVSNNPIYATINATIFEKPYLTLKLTSIKNEINYVNIQVNSFYNRNGYYSLNDKNSNLDDKFLQASGALSELNASQQNTIGASTTTVRRYHLIPGMVPGNKTNQIDPDGYHISATAFSITASASNKIYYNTTANTVVITGIDNFDIKKFSSPGTMLLQGLTTVTSVDNVPYYYVLFNYQSIEVDTAVSNKYTFKNVNINYFSSQGRVIPSSEISTTISSFSAKKFYFYYIKSTTDNNIPLYAFNFPELNAITYSNSIVNEFYNIDPVTYADYSISLKDPVLTFKPHNGRDSTVVGILNSNGDFRFGGVDQKDTPSYWDDYAWNIINEFNKALDLKGINAKLRKGSGTGEVVISYPDGYSIELLNGKYGSAIPYVGSHQFSPEINSQSFTKLAVRDDNELYLKNQIQLSRRNIPEISTLLSYLSLGKPEKEFIAMAGNVDDYIIFKEDGVFRIIDNGNYNTNQDIPYFQPSQISTTLICQATGSVQEINGEIIFLSQEGFMSIDGGQIINISQAIQRDVLTLLQTSPKERIRSFVNKSKNIYCCTLINETSTDLDVKSGTYVFNVKTRQWSFINEELLDGLEDFEKRSLVAYKQKSIKATVTSQTNASNTFVNDYTGLDNIIRMPTFTFNYPLEVASSYNNFYTVSRERHTNNLIYNSVDQYDFITKKTTTDFKFTTTATGFTLEFNMPLINFASYDEWYVAASYYPKVNNIKFPLYGIYESNNGVTTATIIDSFIQFFYNRSVYIRFYDINDNSERIQIKLKSYSLINGTDYYGQRKPSFTFDYISTPTSSWTNLTVKGVRLELGVPAKITFNPESGNQPDTNKLFQEFMIHTETSNRSMAMNFKIDGKTSFLSTDRKFEYDSTVNNRNVFRTYVPTSVARGRYLIRQVKHDLPLENLIITGQTIVMRDSGSTRVQKDKDNQ